VSGQVIRGQVALGAAGEDAGATGNRKGCVGISSLTAPVVELLPFVLGDAAGNLHAAEAAGILGDAAV